MRFLPLPFEFSSVKQRNERADGQKYYIGRPLLISPTWSTKFFFAYFLRFPLRRIDSNGVVTTPLIAAASTTAAAAAATYGQTAFDLRWQPPNTLGPPYDTTTRGHAPCC